MKLLKPLRFDITSGILVRPHFSQTRMWIASLKALGCLFFLILIPHCFPSSSLCVSSAFLFPVFLIFSFPFSPPHLFGNALRYVERRASPTFYSESCLVPSFSLCYLRSFELAGGILLQSFGKGFGKTTSRFVANRLLVLPLCHGTYP